MIFILNQQNNLFVCVVEFFLQEALYEEALVEEALAKVAERQ